MPPGDVPDASSPVTPWSGDEAAARAYDAWFDGGWGAYAFGVESRLLLRALGPVAGERVLDVGCGTGRFGRLLEERGATVVGVDPSREMLRVARERLQGPVTVAVGAALPFPSGSFDVTIAATVLEFADDPAGVVAEMGRVTRPGGRVAVAALNPRSAWGLVHRRELGRPPWTSARFLSRHRLETLLGPHGDTQLVQGLHVPASAPGLARWGLAAERAGDALRLPGAFRVVVVRRR